MLFTGSSDDRCVISFLPVTELERPVGFDGRHAFECELVVNWLTRFRNTHPITGRLIKPHMPVSQVLHALVIDGRRDHLTETQQMLARSGLVIDSEEARPQVIIGSS